MSLPVSHAHRSEEIAGPFPAFSGGNPPIQERHFNIFDGCGPGNQLEVLEDETD